MFANNISLVMQSNIQHDSNIFLICIHEGLGINDLSSGLIFGIKDSSIFWKCGIGISGNENPAS